jgi:hypothetical protein
MSRKKTDASLIAEAAEWRLIGLLLERPRQGWHDEVVRLGKELPDPTLRAAVAAAHSATEGAYLHLLGPGGAASPREVTYQPFADPGRLLAELATIYDAFVFRPCVEDPIDHVGVEVAFVGYLLLKEAFALAQGNGEAAATTAVARRGFIESHLAALVAPFAQRLEAAGPSYLLPTVQLLAARVPARQPAQMPPFAVDALDVCGACGSRDAG